MKARAIASVTVAFLCLLAAAPAKAKDGIFSFVFETAPAAIAGDETVIVEAPLASLAKPLKVASVTLYRNEEDGLYRVSIEPQEAIDFISPVLIDGKRASIGLMKEGGPGVVGQILWFHHKELDEARKWLKFAAKHFDLDARKVVDKTLAAETE